jgi:acyl-CoA thioesterase FadM
MSALEITHRSTVTEDQIDHLGHMNVQYYGTNARAATQAMEAAFGVPDDLRLRLVDVYTRHHREQLLGTELEVRSCVIDADPDGLRLYHELAATETDSLAATFVHLLVPDPATSPPVLPGSVVDRARERVFAVPAHGASRSISLAADPTAAAPTLAELQDRDLAMRHPRAVGAEECDDAGEVRWDSVPGLTWGGEPVSNRRHMHLYEGDDGLRMGWATMETRMSVRRLPHRGDRIQSFSAVVDVRDKTSQRIQWAYDLERGDLLTTFEIVNLAFDIGGRRAISIPDELRVLEESRLQPDLAVRGDSTPAKGHR